MMDAQAFNADLIYLNYPLYLQKHGPLAFKDWLEVAELTPGTKYTEEQKEALRQVHARYSAAEGGPGVPSSFQAPPYF
jgi:hypothetical protein